MIQGDDASRRTLAAVEQAVINCGPELAVFLVYDRPGRVDERPGLARAFFAQRCVSDEQLTETIDAFRSIGAYVELFEGERPLLEALASGRLSSLNRTLKLIYNGIEGGIGRDAFQPGRKALIPVVADSFGFVCSNSNAYACALGRHKFHYFTVLRALGVPTPAVWHYRPPLGWAAGIAPPAGVKVIAKSTYESWSVGVTEDSVFVVDESCERRVAAIAESHRTTRDCPGVHQRTRGVRAGYRVSRACRVPTDAGDPRQAPRDGDAVMTIDDDLTHKGVSHQRFSGPTAIIAGLERAAVRAFDVLELSAFARIDFRIDDQGHPWITDVGVSPGISSKSSAFRSLAELGFDHWGFLRVVRRSDTQ